MYNRKSSGVTWSKVSSVNGVNTSSMSDVSGIPGIVTNDLVLHVDVGDPDSYSGSGTTLTDIVSSFSLSANGNPVYDSLNGGYFVYDGTDDYHDGTKSLSGAEITASLWFYLNASNYRQSLFTSLTNGYADRRFLLNLESDEKARFIVFTNDQSDSTNQVLLKSTTTLSSNTFYNLTCTYDATNGSKIYINGSLDCSNSSTLSDTLGTGTNVRVAGRNLSSVDELINGGVASFKIYSRSLSASEVLQNYNSTKSRYGL